MGSYKQHSQAQLCKSVSRKVQNSKTRTKMATQNREITKYCCCNSNISGAKAFAITYMVTLIPIGILMAIIWTIWKTVDEDSLERNVPFYAMSASFTYWFFLSILVLFGANARKPGMLMTSFILAIIGVLGLLAYLFIFYFRHPKGLRTGETELFWVFIGSCMKILFSVWYILVIHGAFKEAKQRDNTGGIVYSPGNPELGQPIPMQPMGQPVGYVAVPTQAAPPPYQPSAPQVYPDLPQK